MKLKPHAASERAFVWTTLADFADEEPKQELLAIRLKDAQGLYNIITYNKLVTSMLFLPM